MRKDFQFKNYESEDSDSGQDRFIKWLTFGGYQSYSDLKKGLLDSNYLLVGNKHGFGSDFKKIKPEKLEISDSFYIFPTSFKEGLYVLANNGCDLYVLDVAKSLKVGRGIIRSYLYLYKAESPFYVPVKGDGILHQNNIIYIKEDQYLRRWNALTGEPLTWPDGVSYKFDLMAALNNNGAGISRIEPRIYRILTTGAFGVICRKGKLRVLVITDFSGNVLSIYYPYRFKQQNYFTYPKDGWIPGYRDYAFELELETNIYNVTSAVNVWPFPFNISYIEVDGNWNVVQQNEVGPVIAGKNENVTPSSVYWIPVNNPSNKIYVRLSYFMYSPVLDIKAQIPDFPEVRLIKNLYLPLDPPIHTRTDLGAYDFKGSSREMGIDYMSFHAFAFDDAFSHLNIASGISFYDPYDQVDPVMKGFRLSWHAKTHPEDTCSKIAIVPSLIFGYYKGWGIQFKSVPGHLTSYYYKFSRFGGQIHEDYYHGPTFEWAGGELSYYSGIYGDSMLWTTGFIHWNIGSRLYHSNTKYEFFFPVTRKFVRFLLPKYDYYLVNYARIEGVDSEPQSPEDAFKMNTKEFAKFDALENNWVYYAPIKDRDFLNSTLNRLSVLPYTDHPPKYPNGIPRTYSGTFGTGTYAQNIVATFRIWIPGVPNTHPYNGVPWDFWNLYFSGKSLEYFPNGLPTVFDLKDSVYEDFNLIIDLSNPVDIAFGRYSMFSPPYY